MDGRIKKVLRVGSLINGQIVEERLVKPGQLPLSVDEHGCFTAMSKRDQIVFHPDYQSESGCAAVLTKERTMLYGSRDGDAPVFIRGQNRRMPLYFDDRGKITLPGGGIVLFQFVTPPPASQSKTWWQKLLGGLID